MHRNMTLAGAAALAGAAGLATAGGDVPISVITSEVFDVPDGPLVPPTSRNRVVQFIGTGLNIDNDGNWYGAFTFGIDDPNDALETGRDVAFFRNGAPFSREGFQLPNSPEWVPQAEETVRASGGTPYRTARISGDGTVGQRLGGVTGFSLLPDGTPDPGSLIPFATLDTFQLGVLDNTVFAVEGEALEPFSSIFNDPDTTPAPGFDTGTGAIIEDISMVWPISATEAYASIRFQEGGGGTFGDAASALLRITGIGTPSQGGEIIWVDSSGFQFAPLGIELDSSNDFNEGFEAAPDGSFVTTIDIDGLSFDEADAVLRFDAPTDTFSIVAQGGDPSPAGPGRDLAFLDSAVAINEAGDIAYVADDNGDSSDDTFIVVNGEVRAREGDTVGTLAPGSLQDLTDQFGGRNLELDREGNVIWPGVWNQDGLCEGITDSGFGIFNAIFFNDEPIIEAGVTELHDVQIGDAFFETLVVKEIGNSQAGSFTVSPDGDRLIAAVFAVEPSDEICDFSTNNDTVPGQTVLIEVDLAALRGDGPGPCVPADLAQPFGVLDGADVNAFISAFGGTDASADLNEDGVIDGADVNAFISAFGAGCP